MGKFIAVCGSPESGKTVTALKLAQEIYVEARQRVLFFSPDLSVPLMGYLFPHCKESDLYSIGKALDQTDIYKEDVLKRVVTVKTMTSFGYLGFKAGENKYTYPRPTEDKVLQLFACMRDLAEYVIVDCVSDPADLMSAMAKSEADVIIQMISPDLKCMTYYASNAEQYAAISDRTVKVMNKKENDIFLPNEEVAAHFGNVQFVLPYSQALKRQTYTGTLSERILDSKYRAVISQTAKAVI